MKILSISKNEKRSIYSVAKSQGFWKKGRELLKNLGVYEEAADCFGFKDNSKSEINIKKQIDLRYNFEVDKDSDIDLIFGKRKIFIIFSYDKDRQQKFSRIIEEVFER